MFFTAFILFILKLFKLKTEGQTIRGKPNSKVTELRSKFSLILDYLTGPGAPLLGLAQCIYYSESLDISKQKIYCCRRN